MADAPQVAYGNGREDSPHLAYGDAAPEHYTHQGQGKTESHRNESSYPYVDDYVKRPTTILGLRRRKFWILVAILLVVVGATVGGSVGGSLAVQRAR